MATFVRKDQYEATLLDDEWIILNTDNYTITKLNDVGGFCWSLLSESRTLESIVDAIQAKYGCKVDDVKVDIEFFMSNLAACGLVHYEHR